MTRLSSSAKTNRVGNVFCYAVSRFRSVIILYSVLLFILSPLFMLIQLSAGQEPENYLFPLFCLLPCVLSVILPLLLFGYINNKQAVDVFHAAPIRRSQLYWGNFTAGLFIILLPMWVLGLIALLILELNGGSEDGFLWLFNITVTVLASYSMMTFVMVNCGTLFESIVYYLVLNVSYPLVITASFSFLAETTYGYPTSTPFLQEILYDLIPYFHLLKNISPAEQFYPLFSLLPVIMGALFACGGFLLYQRRKSESAGKSFAFRPFFYFGAVLASISIGLGFWLLFHDSGFSVRYVILANLFGLLTYYILDTIRNRGFRRLTETTIVAFSVALLSTAFFYGCYLSGGFGYESRIPTESEVQSAELTLSPDLDGGSYPERSVTLLDAENIHDLIRFHQSLVDGRFVLKPLSREQAVYWDEDGEDFTQKLPASFAYSAYPFDDGSDLLSMGTISDVTITYRLASGENVTRCYRNVPFNLTRPLYEIVQSRTYHNAYYDGILPELESLNIYEGYCSVTSSLSSDTCLEGIDEEALLEAFIEDLKNRPEGLFLSLEEAPLYQLEAGGYLGEEDAGHTAFSLISPGDRIGYRYFSLPVYARDKNTCGLIEKALLAGEESSEEDKEAGVYEDTKDEYEREVFYLPAGRCLNTVKDVPGIGIIPFYRAGANILSFYYYSYEQQAEALGSPLYLLTGEQLLSLSGLITPCGLSETPLDTVVIDHSAYLVLPGCEKQVEQFFRQAAVQGE